MLKAVIAAGGHSLLHVSPLRQPQVYRTQAGWYNKAVFRAKYLRAEHFREDGKHQGGSLPIAVFAEGAEIQRIT